MNHHDKLFGPLKDAQDWQRAGGDEDSTQNNLWLLYHRDRELPTHNDNCLCGHKIKANYYIHSPTLDKFKIVGSCCINKFLPSAEDRLRKCVWCGAGHRNTSTTLCNDCANCCYGAKINAEGICRNCETHWIKCSRCCLIHRTIDICTCAHDLLIVSCPICRWKRCEKNNKIYYSTTHGEHSYLIGLKSNNTIWIKIGNIFYSTFLRGLTDDNLAHISTNIIAGKYAPNKK